MKKILAVAIVFVCLMAAIFLPYLVGLGTSKLFNKDNNVLVNWAGGFAILCIVFIFVSILFLAYKYILKKL